MCPDFVEVKFFTFTFLFVLFYLFILRMWLFNVCRVYLGLVSGSRISWTVFNFSIYLYVLNMVIFWKNTKIAFCSTIYIYIYIYDLREMRGEKGLLPD